MATDILRLGTGLYIDIECKQAICILLGASWHGCVHDDTVRRTGTLRRRRHGTILISSFTLNAPLSSCVSMLQFQEKPHNYRRPFYWRHRRRARVNTCCATNKPISWLNARGVASELTTCVFSQTLLKRGCWNLAWCSVRLSWTHLFFISMTVVGFPAVRVAISWDDKLQSQYATIPYQYVIIAISPSYTTHSTILSQTTNINMFFEWGTLCVTWHLYSI